MARWRWRDSTIDDGAMVRWRDYDSAMVRWSDGAMTRWRWWDGAISSSRYRHRAIVIALSSSLHRTIAPSLHRAIAPSHLRAIAPSSSRHRTIASSSSRHRVIVIAPSTYKSMVRWRDSEVHGPIRIPYIMTKLLYLWVIDTISIIDANLIMYKIKLSQKKCFSSSYLPYF